MEPEISQVFGDLNKQQWSDTGNKIRDRNSQATFVRIKNLLCNGVLNKYRKSDLVCEVFHSPI